jgi:hypothetical protein
MNDIIRPFFIDLLVLALLIGSMFLTIHSPASAATIAGVTERVSISSTGGQGNGDSQYSAISADGRYVAFFSWATDLVDGDTNGVVDVFVYDRQTGAIERVSVSSTGEQGNGGSLGQSISADGRYVVFSSWSSNLVSGDTNGYQDVFVHDRQTGETNLVSVASDGTQGDNYSYGGEISGDGRFVAFISAASNLDVGDTFGWEDVFVRNLQTQTTERISVAADGGWGNGHSNYVTISSDGRYVAFHSYASNLVIGDNNGFDDVFIRDRQTGTTEIVSKRSDGTQGNGNSFYQSMSADGRYIAFTSQATNLVAGDTNNSRDIFVRDQVTGAIERVSVASNGTQSNSDSNTLWHSMSSDGEHVAFWSSASNLVSGDTNGVDDIFVHDRQTGETTRVSISSSGEEGDGISGNTYSSPSISADGRFVAFASAASNLVSGDTNGKWDVFVHDNNAVSGYSISGHVFDDNGAPISGVTVYLGAVIGGINIGANTTTNATGVYSFTNLVPADYTVLPVLNNYTFNPPSALVTVPPDHTNLDFYALPNLYSISGQIKDAVGSPLAGVSVSDGTNTVMTDGTGTYTFWNEISGTYTLTPSKYGFIFDPPSIPATLPPASKSNDFTANLANNRYLLGGHVTFLADGTPVAGVSVSDGNGHTSVTNNNGYYVFGEPAGTYALAPTKAGYIFTPYAAMATVPDTSVDFNAGQLFTGIAYNVGVDGYRFGNNFTTDWNDFTTNDMAKLFGANYVCAYFVNGGYCILNQSAQMWFDRYVILNLGAGRCDGMAVTSLRFFEGLDKPSDFQSNAKYTHDLDISNARRNISYFQVLQKTPVTNRALNAAWYQTPDDVLSLLQQAFASNDKDPYALDLIGPAAPNSTSLIAHTVVPFAIAPKNTHTWQIWTYNPNDPDSKQSNNILTIDTVANSWSYNMLNYGNWTGGATDDRLHVVHISAYQTNQTGECFTCPLRAPQHKAVMGTGLIQTTNSGAAVTYTDAQGNQLGYVNGQIVSTIPGAYAMPDLTGRPGGNFSYYLPITGTYTVSLNGDTITQTQQASYVQFGPGYSFSLDSQVSPTTDNQLTISSDGQTVGIQPNEPGSVDLTLTSEAVPSKSLGFHLNSLSLGASQTITVTNDTSSHKLKLDNSVGTDTRTYDLVVDEITVDGSHIFNHAQIALSVGDTEYLSYGSWDGQGDMSLQIDHGSDGTIDETILLSNDRHILLPLLLRDKQ